MPNALSNFLLNTNDTEEQVVQAPAFSLTKVLASAAIIIGPIATLIVDKVSKLNFSAWQIVSLAVGLLLFVAVTASADVLGRSIAAAGDASRKAAEARRTAAEASAARLVPFQRPLSGLQKKRGADSPVSVLAVASGDVPYLLVKPADQPDAPLKWLPFEEVTIG